MRKRTGFTLVEILFVVIIATAILAFAAPAYKKTQARAKYESALGSLELVGNAILSFQRECAMLGLSASKCKWPSTFTLVTTVDSVNFENTSWDAYLKTHATTAPLLNQILFDFGFLRPGSVTNDTYSFYVANGGSSSGSTCNALCASSDTLACMCGGTHTCYLGAQFKKDGTIQRLQGSGCSAGSSESSSALSIF